MVLNGIHNVSMNVSVVHVAHLDTYVWNEPNCKYFLQ